MRLLVFRSLTLLHHLTSHVRTMLQGRSGNNGVNWVATFQVFPVHSCVPLLEETAEARPREVSSRALLLELSLCLGSDMQQFQTRHLNFHPRLPGHTFMHTTKMYQPSPPGPLRTALVRSATRCRLGGSPAAAPVLARLMCWPTARAEISQVCTPRALHEHDQPPMKPAVRMSPPSNETA